MTKFYEHHLDTSRSITIDEQVLSKLVSVQSWLVIEMLDRYVRVIDEILKEKINEYSHVWSHKGPIIIHTKDKEDLEKAINIVNESLELFPSFVNKYKLMTFNESEIIDIKKQVETALFTKELDKDLTNKETTNKRNKL